MHYPGSVGIVALHAFCISADGIATPLARSLPVTRQ
jgi:hypothetical protein